MRVLVVEDEKKIGEALKSGLETEGYEVSLAHSGEDGFFLLNTESYDLVLLDLMLPGRDGIEILTVLRGKGISIPVLILTGRDSIEDRVLGLDSGADDYLVKPFAFPELLARIRLLARRGKPEQALSYRVGDLDLNLVTRRAARDGAGIDLTGKEFELLEYLMRHQGHTISREMIARDVWQVRERSTPLDNVIDVHIARLRRKVDGPFDKKLIRTIRGVGFSLKEDDAS